MATYDTLEQQAAAGDIFAFGGNVLDASGNVVETKPPATSPILLSTTQAAADVQKDQQTLGTLSGTPIDTRYQKLPTESIEQYNARVKQYYTYDAKPPVAPAGTLSEPAAGEGTVSYINPETNQTQVFNAKSLTPEQLKNITAQGFHLMESKGAVPSWITAGNYELGQAEAEATKAAADLAALKGQLSGYMVSDADLAQQIRGISGQWDARIAEMKNINERRAKSLETTGIRLGSRYTGGAGGVFGGIVSEEERQGVARIGELEAAKQAAIAAAKEAARTKNWDVFAKQVGIAETEYAKKQEALGALNKMIAENNNKIREQAVQASRDSAIAELMKGGTTDPVEIIAALKKSGVKATAKEVQDSLTALQSTGAKEFGDIAKSAAQNGAPADVMRAILGAKTIADAYAAAGTYLQSGTGIIGEYNFYKRQAEAAGQVAMDFNAYQNVDANRKARAAGRASGMNLPGTFLSAMENGATGKSLMASLPKLDQATLSALLDYTKNPANLSLRKSAGESQSEREKFLAMAHLVDPSYDETQYAARAAIKKDFTSGKSAQNIRSLNTAVGHLNTLANAADQLRNGSIQLWNKITNLGLNAAGDPRITVFNNAATAVESELAAVFKGTGASDQEITQWRENLNSSQSPAQLKAGIDTAIELMGSRLQALSSQYQQGLGKPKDFAILNGTSRAVLQKLGVDVDALDPVATSNIADELVATEQQAGDALKAYTALHPEKKTEIQQKIQAMETSLGRAVNSSEFLEAFPEYK